MGNRKKDAHGNTLAPQRTDEHRIDEAAVKVVRNRLTTDWIERSVTGRDYGIDMMLETFEGNDPTGTLVLMQIKGREANFGDEPVSLSVPVRTLLYARMFQAPFFLVHVSNADQRAHFVWLQKYINTRLTYDSPRWNKQEHVTIHFPCDNVLDENGLAKIRSLATYVAHRDLGIAFLGHLFWLRHHLDTFYETQARHAMVAAISRAKEIQKLEPFLETYVEMCSDLAFDIEDMILAMRKAETYREFDYGDDDMIENQVRQLHAVAAMFLSQDEGDAFAAANMDTDLPF